MSINILARVVQDSLFPPYFSPCFLWPEAPPPLPATSAPFSAGFPSLSALRLLSFTHCQFPLKTPLHPRGAGLSPGLFFFSSNFLLFFKGELNYPAAPARHHRSKAPSEAGSLSAVDPTLWRRRGGSVTGWKVQLVGEKARLQQAAFPLICIHITKS